MVIEAQMMPPFSIESLPAISHETLSKFEEAYPPHWRGWGAQQIDEDRAHILREAAASAPSAVPFTDMLQLAARLSSGGNYLPQTMASYRYAMTQGLRSGASLIDLAARYGRPVAFQIYPPGLEIPADELQEVDFDYICDCLRRTFDRAAGPGSDGYVAGVARGEYNVVNESYRLYFHGLAFGALAEGLRWINELDEYEYAPWQDRYSPPFARVRWRRIKRTNITKFLDLVPTDWQRIYESRLEREWVRQTLWTELPVLRMAQLLLFWDTLNLRKITLLMRLRPAGDGLRLTAKGRGKRLLKSAVLGKAK